jgi:diguanylate cyclase (GGDEF)-like protein/PAS domain S-box-containing protein
MISLVGIITFISVAGILHLNLAANRRTETVQSLQSVALYAEQLRRIEGRVLSAEPNDGPTLADEGTQVTTLLAGIHQSPQVDRLAGAFSTYLGALNYEVQLVNDEQLGTAAGIHQTQTIPAGFRFRTELDAVLSQAVRQADSARQWALAGMIGTIVLAGSLISALIWAADGRRKATMALISNQEQRFRSIVEHNSDVTLVLDPAGVMQFVTPAVEAVFGTSADQIQGKKLLEMCTDQDRDMVRSFVQDTIAADGKPVSRELVFPRADGRFITLDAIGVSRLDDPAVGGLILTGRDISDRKALLETLRHQAYHDSLTSLPNRVLLADRLEQAINRSHRHGQPITVLFIDLDGFKAINDLIGHAGGDQVLIQVAERLEQSLRIEDTLARLGGDEFVVILEQCDAELAFTIAHRLLPQLKGIAVAGDVFDVGASVGIAVRTDPAITADELLRRADIAMYHAKATAGQEIGIYSPAIDTLLLDAIAGD